MGPPLLCRNNGTSDCYTIQPLPGIFPYDIIVETQKSMAAVMRALKRESGKSTADFEEELEISKSTLQDYLSGKGNPCVEPIEHLAQKLHVDVSFLISGAFSEDQLEVLLKLLDTPCLLSELPHPKRRHFARLLQEMAALWDEGQKPLTQRHP